MINNFYNKLMQQKFHTDILKAENQLTIAIQYTLKQFKSKIQQSINNSIQPTQNTKVFKQKHGIQKQHLLKESLLSQLFQIQDYKTIYNMCAASFLPLTIVIMIQNFTKYGQFIDFNTLSFCFSKADKIFIYWWIIAVLNYSVILIVKWVSTYSPSKYIWIPIYLTLLASLIYIPIKVIEMYNPGFGSSMIILIQGVRMMMKAHSYLRNKLLYGTDNQYKNFWPDFIKKDQKFNQIKALKFTISDISTQINRYSYFFVAPTLIYRDNYTLHPKRSYGKILTHFFNFLMCTYYALMVYIISCKDVIEDLGKNLTSINFILSTLRLMMPSVLFLIFAFFGFLHSWMNAWAQITRFPDRIFYLDWWNSIEFGSYYRKWNIVVHDWLYYYIYIDLARFGSRSMKKYTKILTFLISAVIHQMIVVYAVGFFYPVLFLLFTGPGIILIQNQKKLKIITINFFFWIQMYLGLALIFVLYFTEYHARSIISDNYVMQKWGILHILIPRTIYLI